MRLDKFLVDKKVIESREKAQDTIKKGLVFVNGSQACKVALDVKETDNIEIKEHKEYVSRGAYKLLGAIEKFDINFEGRVVLDMGASTGGFTQVALEHGAKKVYCVDIGKNELDEKLKKIPSIVNMPGRDVRSLKKDEVGDVDIVIGDLSFISLSHILPIIKNLFGRVECVLLLKPQFECGKELAKKFKGVINDKKVHDDVIKEFEKQVLVLSFSLSDITQSPIKGKSGNIEYLVHLNI